MKNTISFLFFYPILTLVLGLNLHSSFAQNSRDSLSYYSNLVQHPQKSTDLINAYRFFVNNKEQAIKENDINRVIFDLQYLSFIEYKLGSFGDSELSAVDALSYLDKTDTNDYTILLKSSLYNHLGMLYREQKNTKKALGLYTNGLKTATKVEDSIHLFNNISNVHKDNRDYEKAKKELHKAYALLPRTKDAVAIALIKDNLGFIYSKLGIDNEGLNYMTEALAYRENTKDTLQIYISKKHLSEFYKDRGDLSKANALALDAYTIAKQINSASYKEDALGVLVELGNGDYAIPYKKIIDSLSITRKIQENKFALIKYDFQKSELKLKASEIQKERQQKISLIYLLVGSVILLSSIILYVILRGKHKKDKIKQVFKTETRISKKIHDELANDVSDIISFVENELEINQENKIKLLNELEDVYLRTRDISTETASVDFLNFGQSLKHLLIQHNKRDVKVIMNDVNSINWQQISEHKKLAVYRSLQELMVNMKKHSNAKLVSVVFKKQNKQNEIRYTDDGDGCNVETIHKNGLTNAEYRMKEAGGHLIFETLKGHGFKATITFNS
ncbi:MAG: tetratricopeptide repeat-containing sensor histidine kinase [Aquaticitalea sp.]